jgi:hypothetical protein
LSIPRTGIFSTSFLFEQAFPKTANCWGVASMSKGTNTNRVVLLRKD